MRKRIRQLKDAMAFLSIVTLVAVGTSLSVANRANGNTNHIPRDAIVWIEGEGRGSGVIVARDGDRYFVLTNWHIVEADGNYTIKTQNNSFPCLCSEKKHLDNVDLALVSFISRDWYNTAVLGDSSNLRGGEEISIPTYLFSYPSSRRISTEQSYIVDKGSVASIQAPDEQGYALVLDDISYDTTSGSPIFNENGQIIGISGRSFRHPDVAEATVYAIPSNMARQLASHLDSSLKLPVATPPQSQPKTNHSYSGNITPLDIPSGSLLDHPSSRNIAPFNFPQGSLLDRQRGRPIK